MELGYKYLVYSCPSAACYLKCGDPLNIRPNALPNKISRFTHFKGCECLGWSDYAFVGDRTNNFSYNISFKYSYKCFKTKNREQLGITQLGITQLDITQLGIAQLGIAQLGIAQLGITQLGITQLGIAQLDITQLGITQLGMRDILQLDITQLGMRDILLF